MAQEKSQSPVTLSLHVLIYTLAVGVFWWLGKALNTTGNFLSLTTLIVLAALFVLHWSQDFFKSRYFNHSKQSYYLDQAVHIGMLFAIRILF
jgi:hypothetical protein